jgi:pyridoxamine 5'-phosphate oxidase
MDEYFANLRREYMSKGLARSDLDDNPLVQFNNWFNQASAAQIDMPNAMSLATSSKSGEVSLRTVLLKSFDEQGFVFFTNYGSKKSTQIIENPHAALLFPWLAMDRQIKISGTVEKISTIESVKYFVSRPIDSQIAASSSRQSQPISNREALLREFNLMKKKVQDGKLPLPEKWGGYRVIPKIIEFWQGRENRLHDRFEYRLTENQWQIQRLNP